MVYVRYVPKYKIPTRTNTTCVSAHACLCVLVRAGARVFGYHCNDRTLVHVTIVRTLTALGRCAAHCPIAAITLRLGRASTAAQAAGWPVIACGAPACLRVCVHMLAAGTKNTHRFAVLPWNEPGTVAGPEPVGSRLSTVIT